MENSIEFYKKEIRKIYPNADMDWMKKQPFRSIWEAKLEFFTIYHDESDKLHMIGEVKDTELEAWESAYKSLNKTK